MNKENRIQIANDTLRLLAAGAYQNAEGQIVSIHAQVAQAVHATKTYVLDNLSTPVPQRYPHAVQPQVIAETSLAALQRLGLKGAPRIGLLNFASAKNPGGGFLGGAQAQEEALARSSGLYACLTSQMDSFYEPNRNGGNLLYLDTAVASPDVPFFKNDDGQLLPQLLSCTVVTAAAPNAGAIANNEPHNLGLVLPTLERRAAKVLQLFALLEVETLILGAWGCGVFRNDPSQVAKVFARLLLTGGAYSHAFRTVTFAIPGFKDATNHNAFIKEFSNQCH